MCVCVCVFFFFSPLMYQVELIDPALKGTINVLRSCAKNASLKRVVLTSSITAVIFSGKPLTPDVVVDESWISDHVFCETSKVCRLLSITPRLSSLSPSCSLVSDEEPNSDEK